MLLYVMMLHAGLCDFSITNSGGFRSCSVSQYLNHSFYLSWHKHSFVRPLPQGRGRIKPEVKAPFPRSAQEKTTWQRMLRHRNKKRVSWRSVNLTSAESLFTGNLCFPSLNSSWLKQETTWSPVSWPVILRTCSPSGPWGVWWRTHMMKTGQKSSCTGSKRLW